MLCYCPNFLIAALHLFEGGVQIASTVQDSKNYYGVISNMEGYGRATFKPRDPDPWLNILAIRTTHRRDAEFMTPGFDSGDVVHCSLIAGVICNIDCEIEQIVLCIR